MSQTASALMLQQVQVMFWKEVVLVKESYQSMANVIEVL